MIPLKFLNAESALPQVEIRSVQIGGQRLRVGVRSGNSALPLLIFNGIGATLELMSPFTAALAGVESVVFDIPGVGGSPATKLPYRPWQLARLAARLMTKLGYSGPFDVLGISWGGVLAQQFAFQHPQRCRKLVLVATVPGTLAVPSKLSVLLKMVNPRRHREPARLRQAATQLYGGEIRRRPELLDEHIQHLLPPPGRGHLYQLLAIAGWSSLPWLPLLRQPTLVLAGSDDPIVPVANARILAALIPKAKLHLVDDGHLFLITRANEIAQIVQSFLKDEATA